jgi:ABC-type dipeptide/oligopeptide/nickel transport system ATPase component
MSTDETAPDTAPRVLGVPAMGLVVLVGVSGSGKSTFAARHFKPTEVISSDYCRGLVSDDENDVELRVAFDFDGVIADDASEFIFKTRDLEAFHAYETEQVDVPHSQGPLADLFRKLAYLRELEDQEIQKNPQYERVVRLAIVTARSAPAHARLVTTLKNWGVSVDET